jgi:hypothetical protein
MMQNDNGDSRKFSSKNWLVLGASILLVLFAVLLLSSFRTGSLVVSTNDKSSSIQVRKENESDVIKSASGHLNTKLNSGHYVITVSNRTSSRKQTVQIKGHHTSAFQISLSSVIEAQQVYPYGAYAVVGDSSKLYFVDMSSHYLYKTGSDGIPRLVNGSVTFDKVVWQNSGNGFGLSFDGKQVYQISNDSLKPINFSHGDEINNISLSQNGKLAVSAGKNVYAMSNGNLNKIYSASDDISALAAGNQYILVGSKEKSQDNDSETDFQFISYSGQKAVDTKLSAYSYVWSPNGNYLAMTGDSATTVFDAHFKAVANIPDINVLGLNWLDDTKVIYGLGTNVYSYDIKSLNTDQLSTLANQSAAVGLYVTSDSLYVSADSGDQSYSLAKVSLTNKAADYTYQLGHFLPIQIGGCYGDYAVFTQPVVGVSTTPGAANCTQTIQSYLSKDGVDPSKFGYYTK